MLSISTAAISGACHYQQYISEFLVLKIQLHTTLSSKGCEIKVYIIVECQLANFSL